MLGRNRSSATILLPECGNPRTSAQRAKHENRQCFAGEVLKSAALMCSSGPGSETGKERVTAEIRTTGSHEVFGNYSMRIFTRNVCAPWN